jgi:hypothetical protein
MRKFFKDIAAVAAVGTGLTAAIPEADAGIYTITGSGNVERLAGVFTSQQAASVAVGTPMQFSITFSTDGVDVNPGTDIAILNAVSVHRVTIGSNVFISNTTGTAGVTNSFKEGIRFDNIATSFSGDNQFSGLLNSISSVIQNNNTTTDDITIPTNFVPAINYVSTNFNSNDPSWESHITIASANISIRNRITELRIVPSPSSIIPLALIALGSGSWRKRNNQAAPQPAAA